LYIDCIWETDFNSYLKGKGKCKGKGHPCAGTEALYRPYGPEGG